MREVRVDILLCDRIVRYVDVMKKLLPAGTVNLVFGIFTRTVGDALMKRQHKSILLDSELKTALKELDSMILEILLYDAWPADITCNMYKDFTKLKVIIS